MEGKQSLSTIESYYLHISSIYNKAGDFNKALSNLEIAFSIALKNDRTSFSPEEIYYTKFGSLYSKSGNYDKAMEYFKKAIETQKDTLSNKYLDDLRPIQVKLANTFKNLKQFNRADSLWNRIIFALQGKLDKKHKSFRTVDINDLYWFKEKNILEKMIIFALMGKFYVKNKSRVIEKNDLDWFGEKNMWEEESEHNDVVGAFYNYISYHGGDSLKLLASDFLINNKSEKLFFATSTRELVKHLKDKSIVSAILQLNKVNQKIARAELLNKDELLQKGWNLSLLRLEQEYFTEKIFTTTKVQNMFNPTSVSWYQVQKKLKSNEALIDYYTFYDRVDSVWVYHAMLIKKKYTRPIFIPISKTEPVVDLLKIKNHTPIYLQHKEARQEMYSHVWQALEPHLENIKTIHLVPVTSLNKIDFESLQNDTGQYLIDLFKFHYYTSSRDFATQKQKRKKYTDAQLYGHIAYNKANKLTYQIEEDSIDANLKRDKLVPLPATLKEIKIIEKICEENKVSSNTLTIDAVKEDTLAHFSGDRAPDIIHFATHGAYLLPFNEEDETMELASTGQDRFRAADNPLQRAMLMLSNAGETWQNSANILTENDGILTALEVTNLDLSNTELVVLSACNSGIGSQHTTEGVFGMPRAFKLAGVDKILVSLWPVEDETTKELMILFYTNLLQHKQDAAAALRNAKAEMRKRDDRPKKWAGFVLVE